MGIGLGLLGQMIIEMLVQIPTKRGDLLTLLGEPGTSPLGLTRVQCEGKFRQIPHPSGQGIKLYFYDRTLVIPHYLPAWYHWGAVL